MVILNELFVNIFAALCFLALGVHFFVSRYLKSPNQALFAWERAGIALALIIQGVGLALSIFPDGKTMHFSVGVALAIILWLAVFIYWLESFSERMEGLQPIILILAAFCALAPVILPTRYVVSYAHLPSFYLHLSASILAYSLLTLASIHAIFMAVAEQALHRRVFMHHLSYLPPLLVMEKTLFHMIYAGFALLSVAVLTGVIFAEEIFGKAAKMDHKTVFATISWFTFATLIFGRFRWGWRGRRALHWTLTGFLFLMLAYIGSRFVLEVLLERV